MTKSAYYILLFTGKFVNEKFPHNGPIASDTFSAFPSINFPFPL